jgi:hypothetical protein
MQQQCRGKANRQTIRHQLAEEIMKIEPHEKEPESQKQHEEKWKQGDKMQSPNGRQVPAVRRFCHFCPVQNKQGVRVLA